MTDPIPVAQRIIVALDAPDLASALAVCDRLPQAIWFKVGLELFISAGAEILPALRERGKQVFLDLKFHDIPNTVASACRSAVKYGVQFLSVHAMGGQAMLQSAQEAIAGSSTELLAVTVLTSLTPRELAELQIALELPQYILHLCQTAHQVGIKGVVCSPHEVKHLREHFGTALTLVTPGVRPHWAEQGDQARTMTPAQAIALGANYLVIGRPITHHPDPAQAWAQICQEIANP